jgi:hypothetical protein
MIVHDLDVFGACVRPTEAHSELIVYTDAMLSRPITPQGLQPIARGHPQIVQTARDLQLPELTSRNGGDVREPFDPPALRNSLRVGALERLDHGPIVTLYVINVKRDYRRTGNRGRACLQAFVDVKRVNRAP